MVLLFGGMAFAVIYQIKKTDPKNIDSSAKDDIKTAQEFLPFEDIKDSMVHLGGHNYRAIIECSSINYNLKTEKEKEIIELSFQRFLNSLTYPITFFIQTKTIDNTRMLQNLDKDLKDTIKDYPHLAEYAEVFYGDMSNLNIQIGNNRQKKKYIIVSFNEALELTTANDDEKYDYSAKELYNRCQIMCDGLSAIGIKGKILNTKEIAELIFSTYHKDNYSYVEGILNGEYLELMVDGEHNRLAEITSDGKLDWILYEAQLRLQTEIMEGSNVPHDVKQSTNEAINELNKIREALGGYYKTQNVGINLLKDNNPKEGKN